MSLLVCQLNAQQCETIMRQRIKKDSLKKTSKDEDKEKRLMEDRALAGGTLSECKLLS